MENENINLLSVRFHINNQLLLMINFYLILQSIQQFSNILYFAMIFEKLEIWKLLSLLTNTSLSSFYYSEFSIHFIRLKYQNDNAIIHSREFAPCTIRITESYYLVILLKK